MEITVNQLLKRVEAGEAVYLLDVRTEAEFVDARLAFTNLRVPYDLLEQHIDQLPQDRETKIFCFCRIGRRSGIATRMLSEKGYTQVYNVIGGITAWKEAGFELVSGAVSQ